MSKNILELLKDKIRDYENNDKTDQLEVTKSLFNEKCKFALALADQIIRWVCVATVRDKPFKERAAVLAPALGKGKKLPKELFQANEIEIEEYQLRLYLDPYNIIKSILDEKEYKPNYNIIEARKKFIDILSLLLSDKYNITTRPFEDFYKVNSGLEDLYQQLIIISTFYSFISDLNAVPQNILLRINHIMARLTFEVARLMWAVQVGSISKYRIDRGKSKKAKTKSERKQPVLEEFYRIDITGMSKRKIASTIKENLDKQQRDVPSRKTIQRYLEEENLI